MFSSTALTRRSRRSLLALCLFGVGPAALAQTPASATAAQAASLPAFEVASIRAVPESRRGFTSIGTYGLPRFTFKGAPLSLLINFAYDVQSANFVNAPKGLDDAVFDVEVTSEDDMPLTYQRLAPRMQRLLQERFGLVAHRGTKEVKGYALLVAKGGPKLTKVPEKPDASGYIVRDKIHSASTPLNAFASMLASPAGRPVVDQTDVSGSYDITLQYAPADDPNSTLPSLFTALKEQLGLELKPATVSVNTLVIEHVNLMPTDN